MRDEISVTYLRQDRNVDEPRSYTRQAYESLRGASWQKTRWDWGKCNVHISSRPHLTASSAFSSAWQRIVSSVEELAASHHTLARGIEHDVVGPLRNFSGNNREMQSMSTIQGNLASMAREVEGRNGKSGRGRNGSVDNATEQWDSQAPYVMEQLQAVDESRCNHLRDVLTQYQTHEVDQVERNRLTAEQCLNALLTVETADEIKMFAVRYAGGGGAAIPEATAPRTPASWMTQRNTRMPPRTDTNSSLTVPGAFPQAQDDRASQRSASSGFRNQCSVGF